LLSGWNPPDMEAARAYRDKRHPRTASSTGRSAAHTWCGTRVGRHCCDSIQWVDPCCEGSTSELGKYGPAVSIYFKFEKWLMWTFVVLAVVNSPSLVLFAGGSFFSRGPSSADFGTAAIRSALASTTLGNLGFASPDELQSDILGAIPIQTASMLVTSLDVAGVLVFALLLSWLGDKEQAEAATVKGRHVTVAQFSVMVPWVPHDTTGSELAEYLRERFSVKVVHVKLCYDYGRLHSVAKRRRRIMDKVEQLDGSIGRVYHAARATVPEALLLRAGGLDGEEVRPYEERASVDETERTGEGSEFGALNSQQQNVVRELLRRRRVLLRADDEAQSEIVSARAFGGVIAAFVTFETRKDCRRVLDEMPDSQLSVWKRGLFQRSSQQFRGRLALRARQPPRPSTVMWHHLMVSPVSQCFCRAGTALASVALMAVSVAAVYGGRLLAPGGQAVPSGPNATTLAASTGVDAGEAAASLSEEPAGPSLPGLFVFVPPIVIAGTNLALNKAMRFLANIEKHHTATGLELSVAQRLIFRQFINTALVPCLVYLSGDLVAWAGLKDVWPAGGYSSFAPGWYFTVGATLSLTALLDLFTPWSLTCLKLGAARARLCCHTIGLAPLRSQRQLNRLMTGPSMDISERYSRLVNTALTCLTFSAGMPALLWIAAACFAMALCVDKLLFVKCWRKPPYFNTRIASAASSSLVYGIILHSFVAVFVFSSSALRTDGKYATDAWLTELAGGQGLDREGIAFQAAKSLIADHMWAPLCVAVAIMLVGVVVLARAILDLVSSFLCPRASTAEEEAQGSTGQQHRGAQRVAATDGLSAQHAQLVTRGSYDELVEAGLLRDLPSYDVRLHPDYEDAFAVLGTEPGSLASVSV